MELSSMELDSDRAYCLLLISFLVSVDVDGYLPNAICWSIFATHPLTDS